MTVGASRDLIWVSSSLEDLRRFPQSVQKVMGFALFQAQCGGRHLQAKPLRGFGGAGVLEIIEDFEGNAFRAVYTVRFADAVYVLHAFQKKSKRGIKTPRRENEWCDLGCGWRRSRVEVRLAGREIRTHEHRHA